jgi:hypothetical protein
VWEIRQSRCQALPVEEGDYKDPHN